MDLMRCDTVEETIHNAFLKYFGENEGDRYSCDSVLNANKLLLANAMCVLQETIAPECHHNIDNRKIFVYQLRNLVCNTDGQGRKMILSWLKSPHAYISDLGVKRIADWFLNIYYASYSVIFQQTTYLQFLTTYPDEKPDPQDLSV